MWSRARNDYQERVAPRDLPELMDGDCSYQEFRACLLSLERVNRLLLGYRPTLDWLARLKLSPCQPVHIVDVGCGGGDLLRRIALWADEQGIPARLTGIDLNPLAIRAAREFTPPRFGITWAVGDALQYSAKGSVDIIVSSLMAHHLEDEQIVSLLGWMEATAELGWFINDLRRSRWSGLGFTWLATVAGWHRFVKHDGPVSFRRALVEEDWNRLLIAAGVPRSTVEVKPWRPGRLCVGSLPPC